MSVALDVGFRFLPPDEEIISYFLLNKMLGHHDRTRYIREVDLLKQEPWELPALSIVQSRYREWLFFYKLNKISEQKTERVTQGGFWKSTGQDRVIKDGGGRVIGSKKTLVFYQGRTPRGVKTDWVMHEFRATPDFIPPNAECSYVVGFLRNKAAENTENSTSNDVLTSTHFRASSSQNNAVAVTHMGEAPQQPANTMDYDLALQTQMEEGIFDYDLSPSIAMLEFDLPSSSGIINHGQDWMEEEGLSLEDLDYEPNEWDLQFGTIDQEKEFMTSMFPPDRDERQYEENQYPFPPDFRQPLSSEDISDTDPQRANEWYDGEGYMSAGTGHGHLKGSSQKRTENGSHRYEILLLDSSVDSATLTEAYQINCLESVQEEKSVNSRACKSQYAPRSLKSVVQGPPKRVQLHGKSPGKAVSRDKTRESGVGGPVVELVRTKKPIVPSNKDSKMDQDRNAKSDSTSRSNGSAGSNSKNSFNFVEMSQLSLKRNPPLVYIMNVLLGVILFMVIVREVMFLH